MNLETIRVVSPESSENPLGFIIINRADFDPAKHEPFGGDLGASTPAERVPTLVELMAARDQLEQRALDLDAEAARLKEQGAAQEVEAQRLRDEAAKQADAGDGPQTAAQLRDALTARGIAFASSASKPELQALLAGVA